MVEINIPRPNLKLRVLENTVVKVLTPEEWNQLMRIYEFGGWKMGNIKGRNSPLNSIDKFLGEEGRYISAGRSRKFFIEGINTYGPAFSCKKDKIISIEEFYNLEDIKKNDLCHIEFYLEEKMEQERVQKILSKLYNSEED